MYAAYHDSIGTIQQVVGGGGGGGGYESAEGKALTVGLKFFTSILKLLAQSTPVIPKICEPPEFNRKSPPYIFKLLC